MCIVTAYIRNYELGTTKALPPNPLKKEEKEKRNKENKKVLLGKRNKKRSVKRVYRTSTYSGVGYNVNVLVSTPQVYVRVYEYTRMHVYINATVDEDSAIEKGKH